MRRTILATLMIWLPVVATAQSQNSPVRNWDFGNGLKGTAEQIASQLNAPVEKAWAHLQDVKDKPAADQAGIDKTTTTMLAQVKSSTDYKNTAAAEAKASAELDDARSKSDNAAALDAGSRFNIARDSMKKMESSSLKMSPELKSLNATLVQDRQQSVDATAAFQTAVDERSKTIHFLKSSGGLCWPVAVGSEVFIDDAKIISWNHLFLTIEISAADQTSAHPVRLRIQSIIANEDDLAAGHMHLGITCRLTRQMSDGDVPTFNAAEVKTGREFDALLKQIDQINGPPKAVLDQADQRLAAVQRETAEKQKVDAETHKFDNDITAGRLVVGMTKDQARAAFGSRATLMKGYHTEGDTDTNGDGSECCHWLIAQPGDSSALHESITVWFNKEGKVKDFTVHTVQ